MSGLASKLQLGDRAIRVIGAPSDLALEGIPRDAAGAGAAVLLFVRSRAELERGAAPALEAARADGLAWVAYPKAGQLGADINRDSLARWMRERGARPVRQVAIDDVWSALRFRPG